MRRSRSGMPCPARAPARRAREHRVVGEAVKVDVDRELVALGLAQQRVSAIAQMA